MNAAVPLSRPQVPRAQGEVRLSARAQGGVTRLGDLRAQGSLKALFPRGAGDALEVVTLNTAGGLTSGDRMRLEARAEAGARLRLSTQAAERAYRAGEAEPARVETRLSAGPGARIDWLPQETILYDGARLERRLLADLEGDATALLVEPLVFGRLAHGEVLREGRLRDRWEVRRDGRLRFADAFRVEGDIAATLDRAGVGGGARAMATVVVAGPGAESHLAAARALCAGTGGAGMIEDGLLFARLLAADGFALRQALVPLIVRLSGAALPKTWTL
ncbi:urease accessory protein UreD [Rubellimicrobium aerolatum]|uniref:Urease accessory protein UreD n=1 Tax=Rubellimicrobium aerolatum TaxID=490979 RepID=A0ABW0SGT0_9RHOB|nr:urease accessory protein UreD [Rubellimicrobium aerolatum]MBP1807466.1 urease accessory protein [Rubellimicrobium aerolatum]